MDGTICGQIMPNKTPDKFTLFVPDEQEPERHMPARLEIQKDEVAVPELPHGAYDPYGKATGSTTQMKKLRTQDLRRLSEWIKTQRTVETLAKEKSEAEAKPDKD